MKCAGEFMGEKCQNPVTHKVVGTDIGTVFCCHHCGDDYVSQRIGSAFGYTWLELHPLTKGELEQIAADELIAETTESYIASNDKVDVQLRSIRNEALRAAERTMDPIVPGVDVDEVRAIRLIQIAKQIEKFLLRGAVWKVER
jgi:hypothetical protein